ncbi:MAG: O-antigen ligase family protein [Phycisphaerae bacterium]|nr:O-antigen ligase family protein [Phycisphaerae bacterium]
MTHPNVGYLEYSGIPRPVYQQRAARDIRWIHAGLWVGGLMSIGVVFSFLTRASLWEYSFSTRVSMIYLPLAIVGILALGWTNFPVAAAIFYGYLSLAQTTGYTFYLTGDFLGALTIEMVLAVPVLITGFFGPPARGRPLPAGIKWGWGLLLLTSVICTLLARDPILAFYTLMGRFLLPIAVTLAVFRRLRGISDYRVVWFGFTIGLLAISVFGFRRAVLGIDAYGVHQRLLGLKGTSALPSLYLMGAALWMAVSRTETNRFLQGAAWLGIVGLLGILIFLSGGRGISIGFTLLALWWFFRRGSRSLFRPKLLILLILGGGLAAYIVFFSIGRTTLDLHLLRERLEEMWAHGYQQEARWIIWMESLKHWASSPLWGMGLNNWHTLNTQFASVHSSLFGILIDTGLLGVAAFSLLFGGTFLISRKRNYGNLPYDDREFFLGCRAAWVVILLVLSISLPFTSGQGYNNFFAYLVFFYPLLAMTVYVHSPQPTYQWVSAPPAQTPLTTSSPTGHATSPP